MEIRLGYRTDTKNSIVNDFFIPVLKHARKYKRSVGFFTSSSLIQIAEGLSGLLQNSGKMYLIVSPRLTEEDIKAIELGYKIKEDLIRDLFIKEFDREFNEFEEEKLNYLAFLIYRNALEIKVAIMNDYGLYHEKIGIIEDKYGNKIAFTGSLNETENAFRKNFESIDVYKSWIEKDRVENKEKDFDMLWNNKTSMVNVMEFPQAVKEKILQYKKEEYIVEKQKINIYETKEENYDSYSAEDEIVLPTYIGDKRFQLRPYQYEAIEKWVENNYQGLFAMATGTGKTLTALAATERLWRDKKHKLAIVIICPYTHLVEQWVDDIKNFNINPIVAYSNTNWVNKLKINIRNYNHNLKKYFCVITTNATYQGEIFQDVISELKENVLFIVDEAHNFGSKRLSKLMNDDFQYRLALSATPDRYFDEDGTRKLLNYFSKQVFEFNLKEAIEREYLVNYYYYPNIVYLNEEEYEEYKNLSIKISKFIGQKGKLDLEDSSVELLLLKRARIINLAENKIEALKNLMLNYTQTSNNIIYCAAGKRKDEEKQIDEVCKMLGYEMNMKIHRFTSQETKEERAELIKRFENKELQALVAIKCLDEGVNIPCIERGFILASTGNSKEFIQRRGRLLRKYKGKKFSYIYDFIVLPRPIEEIHYMDLNVLKVDLSLARKELIRIKEFSQLAVNRRESTKVIDDIEIAYGIKY